METTNTKNWRQELFSYMSSEHNVMLLESEMDQIQHICCPPDYPYVASQPAPAGEKYTDDFNEWRKIHYTEMPSGAYKSNLSGRQYDSRKIEYKYRLACAKSPFVPLAAPAGDINDATYRAWKNSGKPDIEKQEDYHRLIALEILMIARSPLITKQESITEIERILKTVAPAGEVEKIIELCNHYKMQSMKSAPQIIAEINKKFAPAGEMTAEEINPLLDLMALYGGRIVSSASLDPEQIAEAKDGGRMYVRNDSLGFIWIPPFPEHRFPSTPGEVVLFEKWYPHEKPLPRGMETPDWLASQKKGQESPKRN